MLRATFVAFSICLCGCTSRTPLAPLPAPQHSVAKDYIDIQAGWRLTAVTPIVKSGGYILKSLHQQTSGNTTTLTAGADLLGYEIAHYAVKGERAGRVQVEFRSAEIVRNGKAEPQKQSIAPLFQLAQRPAYLRLIYLVRVSNADHNMAVVAATRLDALDALTHQVQENPSEACRVARFASCSWIPEGIAVRPEVLKLVDGTETWVDAPR